MPMVATPMCSSRMRCTRTGSRAAGLAACADDPDGVPAESARESLTGIRTVLANKTVDATATIVQSELGAVGVKVNLVNIEAAQIAETYAKKTYDMTLYGGGNYAVDSWNINVITACSQVYPAGGKPYEQGTDKFLPICWYTLVASA